MSAHNAAVMVACVMVALFILTCWRQFLALVAAVIASVFLYGLVSMALMMRQ